MMYLALAETFGDGQVLFGKLFVLHQLDLQVQLVHKVKMAQMAQQDQLVQLEMTVLLLLNHQRHPLVLFLEMLGLTLKTEQFIFTMTATG
jgi:hypothetical protein